MESENVWQHFIFEIIEKLVHIVGVVHILSVSGLPEVQFLGIKGMSGWDWKDSG